MFVLTACSVKGCDRSHGVEVKRRSRPATQPDSTAVLGAGARGGGFGSLPEAVEMLTGDLATGELLSVAPRTIRGPARPYTGPVTSPLRESELTPLPTDASPALAGAGVSSDVRSASQIQGEAR